jgi:chromosome segregation ATPase
MKTILDKSEDELAESRSRYEHLCKLHNDYKVSTSDEITRLKQEYREKMEAREARRHQGAVSNERDSRDEEIKTLEQHLTSRDIKINELSLKVEKYRRNANKVPDLANRLARKEVEATNLKTENKELLKERELTRASWEEEQAATARSIHEAQSKNVNLVKDMSAFEAELVEERKRYAKMELNFVKNITDLEVKNAALRNDVKDQKKRIDVLEKTQQKAEDRIERYRSERDKLEQEARELASKVYADRREVQR